MKCCARCFGDRGLGDIIPGLSEEKGACSYCLSTDQILVVPSVLAEFFRPLVNIYEVNERGKLLVEWFKAYWAMFDHERMDLARAKDLLADVLDDGEIVRKKFSPSPRFQSDALLRWEQLRDELMYGNRYFPNIQLDTDRLEQLLQLLPRRICPPSGIAREFAKRTGLTRSKRWGRLQEELPHTDEQTPQEFHTSMLRQHLKLQQRRSGRIPAKESVSRLSQ